MPEEHLAHTGLQRHQRRLINISKSKTPSADQVVQLVAKDSIACMLRQNIAHDLNRKLNHREAKTKP